MLQRIKKTLLTYFAIFRSIWTAKKMIQSKIRVNSIRLEIHHQCATDSHRRAVACRDWTWSIETGLWWSRLTKKKERWTCWKNNTGNRLRFDPQFARVLRWWGSEGDDLKSSYNYSSDGSVNNLIYRFWISNETKILPLFTQVGSKKSNLCIKQVTFVGLASLFLMWPKVMTCHLTRRGG